MLDVWPAQPPVIKDRISTSVVDNVVSLLEHHSRVCQIDLKVTRLLFQDVLAAMDVSFPELADPWFSSSRLEECQSFPTRSWADLHHVCDYSS
jgi:hypothetical protein